jgi:hypothetical protein
MESMSHLAVDEQPGFDRGGRHDSVCMVYGNIYEILGGYIYRIYVNDIR